MTPTCQVEVAARVARTHHFFARRVERVTLESDTLRERRASFTLPTKSWDELTAHCNSCAGEHDDVLIPLMVVPKTLSFDLDVSIDGTSAVVVPRELDSAIAAHHLINHAIDLSGGALSTTPPDVRDLLTEICASFPDRPFSAARRVRLHGAASLFSPITREVAALSPSGQQWLARALEHNEWCDELELFSGSYLLTLAGSRSSQVSVVKIRVVENAHLSQDVEAETEAFEQYPYPLATVKFFDSSRAESTHLRVVAPTGTFITDPFLSTRDGDRGLDQSSSDRVVFYASKLMGQEATAHFYLWPEPRDFVTPVRFVSAIASLAMASVAAIQLVCALRQSDLLYTTGLCGREDWCANGSYDLVQHMSEQADATLAIVLLIPSLIVSQLLFVAQNPIRWGLLRPYRVPALVTTAPMVVLAALSIAGFPNYDGFVAFLTWAIAAVISVAVRRTMKAYENGLYSVRARVKRLNELRLTFPADVS